jgi:hypothetical protein
MRVPSGTYIGTSGCLTAIAGDCPLLPIMCSTCGTSHHQTGGEAGFGAHLWPSCGISAHSPSPVIRRQHRASGLSSAHITSLIASSSSFLHSTSTVNRAPYFHLLPYPTPTASMSDNDNTTAAATATDGAAPQFTERELQLLGWAMQSLKSGPPEVRIACPCLCIASTDDKRPRTPSQGKSPWSALLTPTDRL